MRMRRKFLCLIFVAGLAVLIMTGCSGISESNSSGSINQLGEESTDEDSTRTGTLSELMPEIKKDINSGKLNVDEIDGVSKTIGCFQPRSKKGE